MMRVSSTARVNRPGSLAESRGERGDHRGREQPGNGEQHNLAREQQCEYPVGEQLRGINSALLADARICRQKRRIEGTLGKDSAEVIGKPQCDEERICDRTGAQDRGQYDVAREIRSRATAASSRRP